MIKLGVFADDFPKQTVFIFFADGVVSDHILADLLGTKADKLRHIADKIPGRSIRPDIFVRQKLDARIFPGREKFANAALIPALAVR